MTHTWCVRSERSAARSRSIISLLLCVVGVAWSGAALQAQTAHYSGAQSTLGSSFSTPAGVAVDASGNVYVADSVANTVRKLPVTDLTCSTPSDCTTVGTGLKTPTGVAVDSSGNVYIADSGNNRVVRVPWTGSSYGTQTTVGTSLAVAFSGPKGVAVDAAGNVFVADTGNNRVVALPPTDLACSTPSDCGILGGSGVLNAPTGVAPDDSLSVAYIADMGNNRVLKVPFGDLTCGTPGDCTTVGTGLAVALSAPKGVAIDGSNNVYIADTGNNRVLKVLSTDLTCTTSTDCLSVGTGLSGPQGAAVDGSNNVYIADSGNSRVLKAQTAAANLGAVNVGSTGTTTASMIFTFDSTGTGTSSYHVVTQGATGLDFADAGGGNCSTITSYSQGETCTVNVSFSPKDTGARYGAVALYGSTGTLIATGYIYGTGVGPQVAFSPGSQSAVSSSDSSLNPFGIAVDASGNIFVASYTEGTVEKLIFSSGSYTTTQIATGLSDPKGVALDGAGNVFVTTNTGVLEVALSNGSYALPTTIVSSSSILDGVAVDPNGNIYFTDFYGESINKITLSNGSYTLNSPLYLTNGEGPAGIAVDEGGDLFISNYNLGTVYKFALSNGSYTESTIASGLSSPESVAVDASGSVYISTTGTGNYTIYKESPASGGTYTQSEIASSVTPQPWFVALDGSGNLYFTSCAGPDTCVGTNGISKIDLADAPSLTFASTAVGSTSGDSPQTVGVANIGNLSLTFGSGSNPLYPTNFPENTGGSNLCGAGTILTAGGSCNVSVNFTPTGGGSVSTDVVLTDNALNVTNATQDIPVSGTVTGKPSLIITASSPAVTYGSAIPAITASYSGFVNGDTAASLTTQPTCSTTYTTSSAVGSSPSTSCSGAVDSNYNISYVAGAVTVNQAALSITASSPAVTYGSAIPTITPSYSGFVNGQSSTVLTTQPTCNTTYTTTSAAGSSPSTSCSGAVDPNYNISYVAGAVTVSKAALSITASSPTVTYGAAVPTITPSYSGFVNGQSSTVLTTQPTCTTAYTTTSAAGSSPSTSCSGAAAANYSISYVAGAVTVNQAALSITASSPAVTYGSAVPTITPSYGGFVNGQSSTALTTQPTCTTAYTTTSAAGSSPSTSCSGAVDPNYNISYVAGAVTISKATPTLSVTNSPVTYTGSAQAAVVTGSVAGTANNVQYNGSSTVPTAAGTYAITANFTPNDTTDYASLTGASAGSFVINKAGTPTLSVTNSPVTYNGSPQAAVVTGSVAGTVSNVQYNGLSTVPTAAGTYAITANFTPNDTTDYSSLTGASAGSFVINKATPTVSVTNPLVTYTGSAQTASVTGSVPGTASNVQYNGSSTVPTTAGTYAITANFTPNDTTDYASLTGASAGNFVINKATPTLSVTNSPVTYTGSAQAAVVTGSVAGTASNVQYNGSSTVPTAAGTYAITANFTPNDTTDYASLTGASAGSFVINKAGAPTLSVTNSPVTYNGSPQAAVVTGSVAGTVSNVQYNGSSTVPTAAGTYAITANFAPTDTTDYSSLTGASAGNFVINKATPTISWATPAAITYGTALSATQLNASSPVAGTFTYNPPAGTVLNVGANQTLSVSFTPTDATDYNSTTAMVSITVTAAVSPSFSVSGTSVTIAPGATSGNTSTITLTPAGGFTGSVVLTAALTNSPSGASDLPTWSFGSTSPVNITGATADTATLTISTTPATSSALAYPKGHGTPWYATGGATLACILLFGIPARRRKWRAMLGMLMLFVALTSGLIACGGSSSGGGGGNSGTTPGTYTITVTGTSGNTTATGTVTVAVQ